jgi:hypothetical protein
MEEKMIETNKVFIVSPSKVVDDSFQTLKNGKIKRTVSFERKSDDLSFAVPHIGGYRDILNNRLYSRIGSHCCEWDYYVDVSNNRLDARKYIEYVYFGHSFIKGFDNEPLPKWVEELVLQFKPYYSIPELVEILKEEKERLVWVKNGIPAVTIEFINGIPQVQESRIKRIRKWFNF